MHVTARSTCRKPMHQLAIPAPWLAITHVKDQARRSAYLNLDSLAGALCGLWPVTLNWTLKPVPKHESTCDAPPPVVPMAPAHCYWTAAAA